MHQGSQTWEWLAWEGLAFLPPASETSSAIPPARTTSASGWRTALVRALTTTASTLFHSINKDQIIPFLSNHSHQANTDTMLIPIFISATVICIAGMMICIVYSKNMILAHDNSMLGEDKIRLEKENENNKSRLEKENENNESRLEKENENNKSRLEKENQDNKIRWEKENSKLDTELKEVKAKHGQIISPDYKIIIKLVLQGLKLDCDVSSIHRYTL
ncbi:hypothetical protein Pst134EA_011718 [Puccinia striiformis f. sp. tritici]|uniref:hypothetical protein n=1 Tax=Puccinia striiformis f. sp. tritici TaxID=168172 RepID=UPI002008B160|nr:hypothetical protein Pst134EA_011718 [Puccinia striiformis f. sp. tritici]KAH9468096.1 hypothetical protein Pst134EA_011718 [Puccinia striiformis f. sp. tritici]